ncbi:non-ribosomal peptide synthetase [Paenibacillus sp. YYML68]|uniref:non-ribosomal peptide synthetase n=1 Tax=Paenibacillus sp. YYML68 TaxID=2909250 RepID=UPI002490ED55|nr:non-ribosomal peptide synthetase [Paenibacillus sp. YYML68]
MDKSNILDMYELTPLQTGMLFHAMKAASEPQYFVQGSAILEGSVKVSMLEQSYQAVVDKYDVLRTVFVYEKVSKPIQVVYRHREAKLTYIDLSHLSETEQDDYVKAYKEQDRSRTFCLSKDMLLRLHLLKRSSMQYELIWNFHHIIMDGWCWGLVLEDLWTGYEQLNEGHDLRLGAAPSYSQYIKWLRLQPSEQALSYWRTYLDGYEESVTIPRQLNGSGLGYKHGEQSLRLDRATTQRLAELSRKLQTTLNHVMLSVWGVLLQLYSRQDDVVFGSVVSGRPPQLLDVERMVGLLINTVPVRVRTEQEDSFTSLVRRLHGEVLESKSYEYSSLADIQSVSACGGQLVQHLVVFENYASSLDTLKECSERLGFTFTEGSSLEYTNYDLTVIIQPGDELDICFGYNEQAYTSDFMQRMSTHMNTILMFVLDNPDRCLNELELLLSAEKQAMHAAQQMTASATYPVDKTIHGLFEEQAARYPDHIAVVHLDKTMTYQQLNEASNRFARVLRDAGAGQETIVALSVQRSLSMIISILAIMKAGAAYLPIDPEYPAERIQYTLEDSKAPLLVTDHSLDALITYEGTVVTLAESYGEKLQEAQQGVNLGLDVPSNSAAYIIYTSGSTGKPKGVLVEHRNVVRLLFNSCNLFDFHEHDVWTLFHSMCFDFSVWEMYGALLYGGRLVIVPASTARDARKFRELLLEQKVTILNQTPSSFNMLIQEEADHEDHLHIRKVVFGGEALAPIQLRAWHHKYPVTELINMYGITETTVHVTYKRITRAEMESNVSNIGHPIPTLRTYVMDDRMRLLPPGIPGELYVSGEGVARGYLNRPELTRNRFMENPFVPGERMYRSGDLVRALPNGELEYVGRIDHQVKIRGHRIELGEVNTQLLRYEGIREGIVLARPDHTGADCLCAYYVADGDGDLEGLREHMAASLPEYMVPSFFLRLEAMPVTSNGKIKRDALPEPKAARLHTDYAEPRNELEFTLLRIYQQVLGHESIGMNEHFLQLGGHSLKAAMIVSRLQKALRIDIPISAVLLHPSIRQMANYVAAMRSERGTVPLEKAEQATFYSATSQQLRLYSIQQFDDTEVGYNVPFALDIRGKLDEAQLERAVQQLTVRHEALRTSFHMENEELVFRVHDQVELSLTYRNVAQMELELEMRAFVQPFQLERAPLFRAALLHVNDEDRYVLLMDVHHIVCDGLSVHIVVHDLLQLYQGKALPLLTFEYSDYAAWQKRWVKSDEFKCQEQYWVSRFSGELPILSLPTDEVRPPVQTFEGSTLLFELDHEMTSSLKELAVREHVTLFMTLMAVYMIVLAKYSGQRDLVVGTPLSGRHTAQLEQTVGMFANVIPLRIQLEDERTFIDHLQAVKQELLAAYEHGDYPLEELIRCVQLQRDSSRNPLFDTMFMLQTWEPVQLTVPGLEITEAAFSEEAAKLDLTWEITASDKLEVRLTYNRRLFGPATMERLASHYKQVVAEIVRKPQSKLGTIRMVTDDEVKRICSEFNPPYEAPFRNSTIIELFEARVDMSPELPAAVWRGRSMTYSELNMRANQVALLLQRKGVGSGDIVGVMLRPSLDLLVGVLGVLKAGAAYLPIDPSYPAERIRYFLEDSKARIVVTEYAVTGVLDDEDYDGELLPIDRPSDWSEMVECNPRSDVQPEDLAYVIYTSGSTGKPKGVMIEHRSLCNLTLVAGELGIQEGTRVIQFASSSFDASVWEIFPTLIAGATLYMEDKHILMERGIAEWLSMNGIQVATLPPSLLRTMEYEPLEALQTIVTAGEACTLELVAKWGEGRKLINAYGPTEATVCATWSVLHAASEQVTIGRPIMNTEVYILNESSQLQPVGVPGELCIGGEGVARGYLNRPQLTERSFIAHPFKVGARLYRTGDLARWLPDGTIEYMGRLDHQVKVRGHRVELGEVTACLLGHPDLHEAIVVAPAREDGTVALAAYYSSSVYDVELAASTLRSYMAARLPEYMIPSCFIQLTELPLTANGKIDVKRLPEPSMSDKAKVRPRNQEEEVLVQVWMDVLGIAEIGIDEPYFELGGDSIKALQICAKLAKLNYQLKVKQLFDSPTIMEVAPKLTREAGAQECPDEVTGEVPLTPVQQWVFALQEQPSHWNQAIMLKHAEGWQEHEVRRAFRHLTEHHDALRMIYTRDEYGIRQFNRAVGSDCFELDVFQLQEQSEVERIILQEANRLQRSIQLETGPLVKLGLFHTGTGDHLLIIVHHLVIDAVSWRIILEDFAQAYGCMREDRALLLPAKSTSFRSWSEQLSHYASSREIIEQQPYWSQVLQAIPSARLTEHTVGEEPPRHTFSDMMELESQLTREQTEQLLREAPAAYQSEFQDLLLAAWTRTIKTWTGQRRIAIDLEGHGRYEFAERLDLTRTVGWFTACYPVVYELEDEEISVQIVSVARANQSVPIRGLGYTLLRFMTEPAYTQGMTFKVMPDLLFNYLGQFEDGVRDESISVSDMPVGDLIDGDMPWPYQLELNAHIVNSCLHYSIRYNHHLFEYTLMCQLGEQLKQQLLMMAGHGLKQELVRP